MQQSPDFQQYRVERQVVEHRLARLVQLGLRQARYVGRTKTLFQLLLAATVANLTLLAGVTGGTASPAAPLAALLALILVPWMLPTPTCGPILAQNAISDASLRRQRSSFTPLHLAARSARMAGSRPHF